MDVSGIELVLVDISGTLIVGNEPTNGAVDAFNELKQDARYKLKLVTNTSKESTGCIIRRLCSLGFNVDASDLHSSLTATQAIIEQRQLRCKFFLPQEAMEDFSMQPSSLPFNAVVLGLSPDQFYYSELNQAFLILMQDDSCLIAINKSRFYSTPQGNALATGAFVQALEFATGRAAIVVGKPSPTFYASAISGYTPSATLMIGDDVYDDIQGSQAQGCRAVLVQTGKYVERITAASGIVPDATVTCFAAIARQLLAAE